MTDTWAIKGAWFKNCNCDPGCPCDFNQDPTHDNCEGVIAMRIDQGHFGHVDLGGLKFAGAAYWPGRIDEGDGHILPIVDESADDAQRQAILTIMSGQAGGTIFEIFSAMCPHVREPVFAPIDFEFDIESRKGRLKAGDIIDTTVDTLGRSAPTSPIGFSSGSPTASNTRARTTRRRRRWPRRSRSQEAVNWTTSMSCPTARWRSWSTRG